MNKMIIFILTITVCLLIVFCIPAYAADDYPAFTDTSGVSDATFFGVWDQSKSLWSTAPQLDYASYAGLADVEKAVKAGDYTSAKERLLVYYRNRSGITFPSSPHNSASTNTNYWASRDAFAFTATHITDIDITSSEFTEYSIPLGTNANSGRFQLSSVQKSSDMIEISSRESANPPKLVIEMKDGEIITLEAEKDTYIRAGAYKNNNYGSDTSLYVKDDYTYKNGKYLPYSDNTRRSYVFFDNDKIPATGIVSVHLVINARLVGENGSSSDSSVTLSVINPYNKSWSETEAEANIVPMTWAAYKIDHYSWQGLPGGILWEKPDNVPSEFFNANTRFTQMSTMASLALTSSGEDKRKYMYQSMNLTLDFIADTAGKISSGIPTRRDIESANRCHEFSALYKFYLDSEFMNPDANVAMLKWLYQETDYLYNGAGILYNGATAEVTSNNYANTNRGAWHTMGLLASIAYFPEFAGTPEREVVLNERTEKIVNILIGDDGCYLEPTFGYPGAVINFFNGMMQSWENSGKEPVKTLETKLMLMGRYLMYTGYPDGNPPRWGENYSSARNTIKSIHNYSSDAELLYYVTNGASGTEPAETQSYFDLLKVVTDRTGWSSKDSMIFMNAKNGGNHNHKDSLAITMYYDGREILEDTGMTSYDGGYPSFDWQRHQTRSHNTVEIDETPQRGSNFLDNNGDSSIQIKSDDSSTLINAWTDATEGFRHKRNVMWLKDYAVLIVNDRIEPSDSEEHIYKQNWHTYSKYSSNPYIGADLTGTTDYASGTELIISQADKDGITASLQKGYSAISSDMTQYFCYEKTVSGNSGFATLLVPVSDGDDVSVESDSISVSGSDSAKALKARYMKNGQESTIIAYTAYDGERNTVTFENYQTNGDAAYVVYDENGSVVSAGMYGATMLVKDDNVVLSSHKRAESISYTISDGHLAILCSDDAVSSGFAIGGLSDVQTASVNGTKADVSFFGGITYVNYGFSVNAEFGGSFQYGQFLWSYDSASGVLGIHGKGYLNAYTSLNYTSRPWQSFADEVEYLIIDNDVTGIDMYTFSNLPLLSKVWCSDKFFTVKGNTYSVNKKFAGETEYICSSSTASSGNYKFKWSYTPVKDGDVFKGSLKVESLSSGATLSSVASGGWEHVNYDSLYLKGADNLLMNFESSYLERVSISGTTTIGSYTFAMCPAISEVSVAEGTKYIKAGAFADFENSRGYLSLNMPASLVSVEDIFEDRPIEYIQLYGYPSTVGEDFAHSKSLRFEYITEGSLDGAYTWYYNEDSDLLYIDMLGEIPASLTEAYDDVFTTYEPYASVASTLHLDKNVTAVPEGIFDGGNITTVYCPHDLFDLTYKQAADIGDALYTDENGNVLVYPATVEINGETVPTHNADITATVKNKFAGDASYLASSGVFVSYSKTSSPYTTVPQGNFNWDFDPVTRTLTIECLGGTYLGNHSIRTNTYYPWRHITSVVKSIEFTGKEFELIGKYAFAKMAIEEFDMPDFIRILSMRSLQECRSLTRVSLSENLETIYNYAFYNCKALKTIVLPDSVTKIEDGTFRGTNITVICNVGSFVSEAPLYTDANSTVSVKKRVLSKLSYDNGNINIECGSDNTDRLIKAYYTYDDNGALCLEKSVVTDVKLTKNEQVTVADNLDDADCDIVKIMLALGEDSICPDSKAIEIVK